MKTVIKLDCGEMPPGCGFACGVCVQEMKDILEATDGVSRFAQHIDNSIEIEHDPEKVTSEDLLRALSKLPTMHEGSFVPSLVGSKTEAMVHDSGSETPED